VRALKVAIIVALGALAGSCDEDVTPLSSRPKVACCKLEQPSCHCPVSGTNADGSCRRGPCDAAPVGWRVETDENGCPYYVTGSQSCLSPSMWPEDSGTDAGRTITPIGTICASDVDCAQVGGDGFCSFDPTPVCASTGCDDKAAGALCDSGRGTCVRSVCYPRCTFSDDGAAPIGCAPRTACHVVGTSGDGADAGATRGYGACYNGCTADADCGPSRKCLREAGACLSTVPTLAKNVGDSCTRADLETYPPKCMCDYGVSGSGYCAHACRVETDETCPAGFACDAKLPATFMTAPRDLGGLCHKTCTADADCAALNSTCVAAGGLSVKVCRPK